MIRSLTGTHQESLWIEDAYSSFNLISQKRIQIIQEAILFFPRRALKGKKITSSLIKSICLYHRTRSEEDLTPHKLLLETWQIFISGIGNYPSERFITWRLAVAKHKWATFLHGWKRALIFTEVPQSGHLKLVASSTKLAGRRGSVQLSKPLLSQHRYTNLKDQGASVNE